MLSFPLLISGLNGYVYVTSLKVFFIVFYCEKRFSTFSAPHKRYQLMYIN